VTIRRAVSLLGTAAVAAGAWGWFEAGWPRFRVLEVQVPDLPPPLEGLRIHHLSDFHLGVVGRGPVAVERAVDWSAARGADIVCVTGDLLSRRAGEPLLRRLIERLDRPYVVLGNHDYALSRDPFSQPVELEELPGATVLADSSVTVEVAGCRVQVAGVDPRSYAQGVASPGRLADGEADLRVLLCHFPGVARRLPPGSFDVVLSGHLHGGQICIPYPGGKVLLAHPRSRLREGLYREGETVLHISSGLGTTFVPFRFFARPEATELVLRTA
jgi:uncharacterized protein